MSSSKSSQKVKYDLYVRKRKQKCAPRQYDMDNIRGNNNTEHKCEKCLKTYGRRDLLMRHRRRCKLKSRATSKRKACASCVKAKIKCSYTKPTCLRCEKRQLSCQYTVHQDDISSRNVTEINDTNRRSSPETITLLENIMEEGAYVGDGDDMREPSLDFQLTDELSPLILDGPDNPIALFQPFTGEEGSSPENQNSDFAMLNELGLQSNIVSILRQYPKLLLNEDYRSPFLHRELYEGVGLDMSTLTRTSMAIICSAGLECKISKSYTLRAIDAHRQSLTEAFPKYSCLEQWDILHAMLIHEILELENPHAPKPGFWRPGSRAKGAKSPSLPKMTSSFFESHPEVMSSTDLTLNTWQSWVVSETVRRTIFLANLVNFFASRDLDTREQSLYYQQLDRDLILNLPLPCPQILWTATSEEQWITAREFEMSINQIEYESTPFNSGQPTLQNLFSSYTKDQLVNNFGKYYGLSDSNSLRNLVVLAALEQFT